MLIYAKGVSLLSRLFIYFFVAAALPTTLNPDRDLSVYKRLQKVSRV